MVVDKNPQQNITQTVKGLVEEMKKYSVTNLEALRNLCIENNWFTCGTNRQYDKLFYANENGCPIEEIATIIWLCSDDNWCRRDILSILIDERRMYLRIMRGTEE